MVPPAELAQIQADLAAAVCDKPCVIQRSAGVTPGPTGAPVKNYQTISLPTLKAGLTQPTAGQLQNYDYLIGSLAAWQVKLPFGTDVQKQDYLIIEGKTLVVQVVLDPHSYPGLTPVLASEVK
jgi:hypothetical protein